jgi:hypothetical protein
MSLISCPACGTQVSSRAINCPQCGHPIAASPASSPVVVREPRGSGAKWLVYLVLILLLGGGIAYFLTQTEAGKKMLGDIKAALDRKQVKDGPAKITLERKDQLWGAASRHTLWINGEKIGLIANGATNTFEFTAKGNDKSIIYIEGYTWFGEPPTSNKVSLDVRPGDEVSALVKWVQNGTAFDLILEAKVVSKDKKTADSQK